MNKFISFLILFFFYSSSFAQVQKQFNGVLSIGAAISPGVGADFTVYGYYNDLNGYYTPDSIAVGNEIYDSKCERYSVVSVTSTVGVVVLQVDSIGIASDAPSNGKGVIFEPTESYKYPLISSGLSSTLLACIESYRAILIDEDVASGSGYWSKKDSIVYYDNDVAIGLDTANLSLGLLSKGLHINGQKYAELKFTNQTSGTTTTDGASIYTDSNNDIVLKNNESNGEIRFQTGGSTRMRIDQSGDVGIGVNTPTEKLHVVGNSIFAGEMELDSFPNTRDDLVSPVNFLSTDASGNLQSLPIDSIPSGGASLWTENGTDIYYNSGNVGIGLSDPDEDLEVNGNIKLSSSLPYIRFNGNNSASIFDIKHNNSTKLEFYYNGNRLSYYTPIGTTGQFAFKQYSTGTTADNYPGFSFDGDQNTGMGLYGADQLFLTTGGATRLLANNTGVGIGTTNPIYMLHVASGWIANTTQGIRVKNGDNLTPTYGFVDDGDLGMYRVTTNTLGFAGGAGTNMEISATDIKLNDYPNTRNDLVSPVNFLSTDASGNILSLPIDSIPSGGTSLWSEQSSSELYFDSGETQDRIGVGIASAGLGFDVSGIHIHDNSYSEFKLSTNTSGSTLTDGLSFYMDNTNKAGLINKENANLELGTNGAAEVLITTGGEVVLNDYPNTRDDLVSPVNFLGTNAGGKIISLPMDSIPSGGAADGNGIYTGSGSLSANTLVTGGGYDLDLNGLADARFEAMTGQFYISSSVNSANAIDINTTALGGDIDMDSADDIHITAADDVNIISSTQHINISTQETGDDINIGSNSLSGVDINIGHNNDDDISLSGMDLTNFDASNANIVGINSVSGAIIHYNQTDVPHNIGGIITSGSWTASNRTKINTTNTGTPSTALPTSGSFQLTGDVLTYLNKSASTTHEITGHIDNTASSSINILAGDSAELVWDGTTWWVIRNN